MLEPPGHYLCTTEPGWSVCVISIQKDVNATSAEKRLVRKRNFPLYIHHRRELKQYSQNACFCMFSVWPWPLTYFSHHGQYMHQVNQWSICFPQSNFHICPLWPWPLTLQRVRLANRGRLLLRTPGPVPFGTCIWSNVETILSWTCHVYGPFEFRTSLGTSILPFIHDLENK